MTTLHDDILRNRAFGDAMDRAFGERPAADIPDGCPESHMDDGRHTDNFYWCPGETCSWCGAKS